MELQQSAFHFSPSTHSLHFRLILEPYHTFTQEAKELDTAHSIADSHAYTVACGIRNCMSIPTVLKDAHRVLKPEGAFACLESSHVNNLLLSHKSYVVFTPCSEYPFF